MILGGKITIISKVRTIFSPNFLVTQSLYLDGEEKMPSCGDYIMHFLTLPWKLLFALIPPTGNVFSY